VLSIECFQHSIESTFHTRSRTHSIYSRHRTWRSAIRHELYHRKVSFASIVGLFFLQGLCCPTNCDVCCLQVQVPGGMIFGFYLLKAAEMAECHSSRTVTIVVSKSKFLEVWQRRRPNTPLLSIFSTRETKDRGTSLRKLPQAWPLVLSRA
jgi:hypothetical protein